MTAKAVNWRYGTYIFEAHCTMPAFCEVVAYRLSAPQGEVERLREALRDLWGIVHGCDLRLSVPMETIAKVRAALAQPEAGGE